MEWIENLDLNIDGQFGPHVEDVLGLGIPILIKKIMDRDEPTLIFSKSTQIRYEKPTSMEIYLSRHGWQHRVSSSKDLENLKTGE